MKPRLLIPLILFLLLVIFLAVGLSRDPHEVPSPLIGKPAPTFEIGQLADPHKIFSPESMKGQVWMLNVWASWCVACREEHHLLMDFSKTKTLPIIGLDYKDQRPAAIQMLAREGNPYTFIAFDGDGHVGIDYGVYGVPETYIIDKAGVIRYKNIGPITPEILREKITPLITELNQS